MAPPLTARLNLLPREGLVLDPILRLIRHTLINPRLLLPLLLLLTRTHRGQHFTQTHPHLVKRLRYLLYFGVLERTNRWLSRGALNNWTEDETWDWNKEVVVVTGGSSGIGEALVKGIVARWKALGGKRGKIVVLDVVPLGYEAPPNVHFYHCDLSQPDSIIRTAAHIRRDHGPPTVLINNAGVCRGKPLLSATHNDIRLTFDVNTLSHFYLVKEFLPHMVETNHGHIVTVASVGAYVQAPRMVDYNASKAAALSFHEGLRLELLYTYKSPKVRTTLVTQGYVKTPLFEGYRNDSKFLLPALHVDTLSDEIVDQLMSCKGGHIVLPRAYNAITSVRGWFSWVQVQLLTKVGRVMDNFNGRQVIDPNTNNNAPSTVTTTKNETGKSTPPTSTST